MPRPSKRRSESTATLYRCGCTQVPLHTVSVYIPLLAFVLLALLTGVAIANHRMEKAAHSRREVEKLHRLMFIAKPLHDAMERHRDAVSRRLHQIAWKDAYGGWVTTKWRKELDYFFDTNVRANLDQGVTSAEVLELRDQLYWSFGFEDDRFDTFWLDEFLAETGGAATPTNNGLAFEREIGAILAQAGYSVSFTPASGDQGVDLMAERRGERLAVQCKDYQAPVGNDAVQQVFSGGAFYRAQRNVVVARRGFTISALQLANSLGVICAGPSELVHALNAASGARLEKDA